MDTEILEKPLKDTLKFFDDFLKKATKVYEVMFFDM